MDKLKELLAELEGPVNELRHTPYTDGNLWTIQELQGQVRELHVAIVDHILAHNLGDCVEDGAYVKTAGNRVTVSFVLDLSKISH